MRFSPDFVERVAEANNIVDIISQYTSLKSSGGGFMGRCPFPDHPEKTPSFSVSEMKQVYHCFGCHKKGNIFSFLQQYNGMSFPDSVEYLASRASIALPVDESPYAKAEAGISEKKKQIIKINKHASQFFQDNLVRLSNTHPVWGYIEKRGLSKETIETFAIGYAGEEWDALTLNLQAKMISLPLAEEARLIKARTQGKSGFYDLFRDRLMFPIRSQLGDVLAFGGRVVQSGEPKYLNSPETLVFHKGKTLYGLFENSKHIRAEDQVIVVEGYMDLVSLHQAGVQNVVASMGTALTIDQAKLLRRLTKNVVVMFDGDSAGQEAAERSLPILLQADLHARGLILPNDLDPDDYVRSRGVESLRQQIAMATDLYTLILNRWLKNYRGEAPEKVQICDLISPILAVTADQRLRQLYISETAVKMGVNDRWLLQAISGPTKLTSASAQGQRAATPVFGVTSQSRSVPNYVSSGLEEAQSANSSDKTQEMADSEIQSIKLAGAPRAEVLLIALVLKNRANLEAFLKGDLGEKIAHTGVKKVLERSALVARQTPDKFDKLASLLVNEVDRPEQLFLPDAVLSDSSNASDGFEIDGVSEQEAKLLQDCFKRIRQDFIQRQIHQISLESKSNPTPEKLEQLMLLQRERLAIKQDLAKADSKKGYEAIALDSDTEDL